MLVGVAVTEAGAKPMQSRQHAHWCIVDWKVAGLGEHVESVPGWGWDATELRRTSAAASETPGLVGLAQIAYRGR